jgi:RNA polymerase sigma-70 factor (ECF subfamily)
MPEVSTKEAERLRGRDSRLWEALVESQYARLYNLHLRLTADPEAAADLTQETFEAAWRAAGAFRGQARPEVWLYGVALNVNRHWRGRAGLTEPPEEADPETLADPEPTPAELALLHERQELVCGAVRRLPEAYRRAVVLRYFLGVPAVEIAAAEGVEAGTVRWRLHEALRRLWILLQPALGKEYETDEPQRGNLKLAP